MAEPKDARQTEQGRLYQWGGETFVSATNVISVLNKPALVPSARKIQAEVILDNLDHYAALIESQGFAKARMQASRDAKQIWDAKTERGTQIHEAIQNMVEGHFDRIGPDLEPWMKHLDQWLMENNPNVLHSEVTVFNRTHRYAGTVDWIMQLDHADGPETVCVDTKSGGVWPEVALQLSAYRWAEFMGIDGQEIPLPQIDRCAVLHLTEKGCELIPVRTGEDTLWAFLRARDVWTWCFEISKTVLP